MIAPRSAALQREADVVVVGAGPAGIAAVPPLLAAGRRVIWVDQAAQAGGQIWRANLPPARRAEVEAALAHPHLQACFGHTVVNAHTSKKGQQTPSYRLMLHGHTHIPAQACALHIAAPNILLALGARERFLPLPGWTLPGVSGAGGLQALVKQGWPAKGKKIVLAGSGPLLLAAADTLRQAGGQVLLIAEQSTPRQLLRFAAHLTATKLAQAAGLAWRLRATPYRSGSWVEAALGETQLEGIRLNNGRRRWELACDALGLGFGLLPNTELAQLLGCQLGADGAIAVDTSMASSCAGIYAAGECTGIGGMDKSWAEGRLAAQALLNEHSDNSARRRALRFSQRLTDAFALRPELLQLAHAQTMICRCEDVSLGALKAHEDWRDAKLQTRCGMGACQGRICGPITETLLGWPPQQLRSIRTPLHPAPLGLFAQE